MNYYLVTLGCPKNVVDSEGMGSILNQQGHTPVAQVHDADVLIVNTCGFLAAAREESLDELRALAEQKAPGQRLIAAGCMIEHYRSLLDTIPGVDATLSTRAWATIGDLLDPDQPTPSDSPRSRPPDWYTTPIRRHSIGASAYIKISDGCSLHCAFCTIPRIKGDMRSKQPDVVLDEARQLVAQGVQELVLVAQHTTDYGRDLGMHEGLSVLLDQLCESLPPDVWVRLMYAYPQSVTPRLIETMARSPQLCAYLDMPLQHAHPRTLRRMQRPPDMDRVRGVIAALREAMPHIALRSTFIVGFPGETRAEFQALLDLLYDIRFDWVGIFQYSREAGTPAATLPNQVPPHEIEQRWHEAMQLQQQITRERQSRWVGHEFDVLIEGSGSLDDGQPLVAGRSFREAPEIDGLVFVPGTAPMGSRIRVQITDALDYDLWGEEVA